MTLSLCMIVKNEELTLARCLDSVKDLVDEIIIVDTGSDDKTIEIAKKYTDKLYHFNWCDDFSKARNYSFSKATKDYIIWLDADDVVEKNELNKLINLKNNLDKSIDVVMLKYLLLSKEENTVPLTFYRERILKNDGSFIWQSPIHEAIESHGNVIYKDIYITHKKEKQSDPKRNLRIFKKMVKEGYNFDARQSFYYARELYYNNHFNQAIKEFTSFLKRDDAWSENKISACIDLYNIYLIKNNHKKALAYLFKTFEIDLPRSEVCCYIGNYFLINNKYEIAIYWYTQAYSIPYKDTNGGFYLKDFSDFIPYLNLCVCYYHLKDYKKSIYYNNLAGRIKPNDKNYLYNYNILKNTNS